MDIDSGNDVPDTPTSTENASGPTSEESVEEPSVFDRHNTANDILPDANEPSQSAEIHPESMDEDAPSSALPDHMDSFMLNDEVTKDVNTEISPNTTATTANVMDQEHAVAQSVSDDVMRTTLDTEQTLITEDKEKESHSLDGQEHIDPSSENVEMMETTVNNAGSCDETKSANLEPGIEKIGEASYKPQTEDSSDEPVATGSHENIDKSSVGPEDIELGNEPVAYSQETIDKAVVGPKENESSHESSAYLEERIDKASVESKDKKSSDILIASSEEVSVGLENKNIHDEPASSSEEKTNEASVEPKDKESSGEPMGEELKNQHKHQETTLLLSEDHSQESEVCSKLDDITETPKTSMGLESDNVLSDDMDSTPSETTTQSQQGESVTANDVNISIKLESFESLACKSGSNHAVVDSTTPFIKSEIPEDVDMEKEADKAENANGIGRLDGVEDMSGERPGVDEEGTVTMLDVLQEQEELEDDAEAVLGASDDKNCTYDEGFIKRQALYACLTCCSEARFDPTKRAGVCLACSLSCHDKHELVELYTKRNFRCDCGNPNFNNQRCTFTKQKTEFNTENQYNQNFSGLYCICHRPYPDPDSTVEDEMIQCIVCEDWLHSSHLDAKVPDNDLYSEMICKHCMGKNEFLHDYSDFAVNTEENEEVDVINTVDKINGHDVVEMETATKENGADDAELVTTMKEPGHDYAEVETTKKELSHDDAEMETLTIELSRDDADSETATKELSCNDAEIESTTKELSHDDAEMETVTKELSEPEKSENITDQNESNIDQKNENSCSDDISKDDTNTNEITTDKVEIGKISSEITSAIQVTANISEEGKNEVVTTENTDAGDEISPTDTTGETVAVSNTNDVSSDTVDTDVANKPTGNAEIPVEDSSTNDISKDITHTVDVVADTNNAEEGDIDNPVSDEVPAETCTTDIAFESNTEESKVAELTIANAEDDNAGQSGQEEKDKTETEDINTSEPENKLHQNGDEMETEINLENNQSITESLDKDISEKTTNASGAELIKLDGNPPNKNINDGKSECVFADTINLGSRNIDQDVSAVAINGDTEMSENHNVDTNVEKQWSIETVGENDDVEMTDDPEKKLEPSVNEPQEILKKCINTENANKRKLSTEIIDNNESVSKKKSKLSDCKHPKSTKRFKGATFWPCSWRQKLCSCPDCVEMYRDKNVLFLLDLEDTITAYEELGKAKSDGKSSQYEKGLKALSSLDRIQQINALTEYNRMKEKLLEYLISFKDRQEVVKVEDVEKFFSNIKPKRKNDGVYFCR